MRRPRRPFTADEVEAIKRLCNEGKHLAAIAEAVDRPYASVRCLLASHNLQAKRQPMYINRPGPGQPKPVRKRPTAAPRKLAASERSSYPVNYAAHARMLRW